MISSELIDEMNNELDNGNTSYSSVCDIVDNDIEIGLQFIRQSVIKKTAFDKEAEILERDLKEKKFVAGCCLTAIKNCVQTLKLQYPFTLSFGKDEILIINSLEDIQVVPKLG